MEAGRAAEDPFAARLRHLRAQAGLTQETLAERAGLSVRGLRYLERGLRKPFPATVLRLAEALCLPEAAEALTGALRNSAERQSNGIQPVVRPPTPAGPIIGRERDLDSVLGLLQRSRVRLLTIVGSGGVGKTRLALESVMQLSQATGTPAIWVPLEALTNSDEVPFAVARAAGVSPGSPRPLLELLSSTLEEHILLLDTMEQLLGTATFVSSLVSACPSLTVVVTSRVPLGIRAEQLYWLDPLTVPSTGPPSAPPRDVRALALNPAVDLFLRRAQAVDPRFTLNAANAEAVATICRRVEGVPLAIELAAARIRLLPPQDMSNRLSSRLELLSGSMADGPQRHRNMRATIAWSYELLDAQAQALFRFVSIFEEGAALSAVEAFVTAHPLHVGHEALTPLDSLVRSSLVQMDKPRCHEARTMMHEMVREYGLEQLSVRGEAADVRKWHANHFLTLTEEAERHFYGPDSTLWMDRLDLEHANLRAALAWCHQHPDSGIGLRMAAALSLFWYVRGHALEGRRHLETFLRTCPTSAEPGSRIRALLGAGQLAQTQGDYRSARALIEDSISLSRRADDPRLAAALLAAGFVARIQEDYDGATTLLNEARTLAPATGQASIEAAAYHHLGCVAADAARDVPRARRLLDRSLQMYRNLGMERGQALVLMSLAEVAVADGSPREAAQLLEQSLTLMARCGEQLAVHGALDAVAELVITGGKQPGNGVRLAAAADTLRDTCGIKTWPVVERRRRQWLAHARGTLDADTYRNSWDEGHTASLDQAMNDARHQARLLS